MHLAVLPQYSSPSMQSVPCAWETVISPVIILRPESPRILAEMERNAQHPCSATPALSILLNALFVFSRIFSKPKTLELLKEEEEWPQRAVGSLLLQIQMFIRSTKHGYKVSWQGKGGRHVASRVMNCTVEFFMSCQFHSRSSCSKLLVLKLQRNSNKVFSLGKTLHSFSLCAY